MFNAGDVNAGSMVEIPFNTSAIAGESITIGTNGTIAIYKDGSTTERTSASGVTFSEDHDGHVGTHLIRIDLSDNADPGFYAANAIYKVKYHTATIDGKSVSVWVGMFSIDKTNQKADVAKWLGTAVSTPTTAGVPNVNVKTWNDLVTVALPLCPTVAGRTVDVAATGEVGLDWSNMTGQATAQALSNTSILTVSGNVNGSVASVTNGVTVATGGIVNASFGDDAIDGRVIDADADPWTQPLPGAYSAGSAGYIIGTFVDVATSSRLAPTVSGRTLDVSTGGEAGIDLANVGSPTTVLNLSGLTIKTATDVEADTQDIQSRLPAALVSGRMDASTGAMQSNVITAAAIASDAGAEIADAVWDEVISGHLTAGTTGAALNAAGSAGDPWATSLPGSYGAGTAGKLVGDNVNASIAATLTAAASAASSSASAATSAASADTKGTTILARLGAWTGTGVNTVLGAIRALFRRDADVTVPSDINADLGSGAGTATNGVQIQDAALREACYSSDTTKVQAFFKFVDDDSVNDQDHYAVCFAKNGQPGGTVTGPPTIRVVKSDNTNLISATNMTQVGSLNWWVYNEATNRVSNGQIYKVIITATVDGVSRTWEPMIGKDS